MVVVAAPEMAGNVAGDEVWRRCIRAIDATAAAACKCVN
jgi:hypothetical protein